MIFSASQVDTYIACPRKWAWHYIDGLPRSEHASAQLGTDVHSVLEDYLGGTPLPLSSEDPYTRKTAEIALAGLHLLPRPSLRLETEGYFELQIGPHRFRGLQDLWDPEYEVLLDHKTTADFKWAKNDLAGDVQAALYAAHRMVRHGKQSLALRWVYYRTKQPYRAMPVDRTVSREDIEPTLIKIRTAADEMQQAIDRGARAIDLPFDPGHCAAYGGCPYISNCNLTISQIIGATMTQASREAFLAQMGINPPQQPAGLAYPPQPQAPPFQQQQQFQAPPQQQQQQQQQQQPQVPPPQQQPQAPFATNHSQMDPQGNWWDLSPAGQWVMRPPGGPSPFQAPPQPQAQPQATQPQAPQAPAARKRGRPKASEAQPQAPQQTFHNAPPNGPIAGVAASGQFVAGSYTAAPDGELAMQYAQARSALAHYKIVVAALEDFIAEDEPGA